MPKSFNVNDIFVSKLEKLNGTLHNKEAVK